MNDVRDRYDVSKTGPPSRVSIASLARFVPTALLDRLQRDFRPLTAAVEEPLNGVLFFADMTGFSRLTEQLAQRPDGAERISACLNDYLGRLVDLVYQHGGDVLKFAGDALIAVWPATGDDLPRAASSASACALRAQEALKGYTVEGDLTLAMRISIGAGDISLMHVGGMLDRWETMIVGAPVRDLASLKPLTPPGAVVVSGEVWSALGPPFTGRPAPRLGTDGKTTLSEIDGLLALEMRTVKAGQASPRPMRLQPVTDLPPPVARPRPAVALQAEAAMRAWLPGVMLSRSASGATEWISELRRVSVLFASIPPTWGKEGDLERVQSVVQLMQRAVYRFDGGIDKISIDEKGAVLVAAFGLPPLSHEDDPARAMNAALVMRSAMAELDLKGSIGVATGVVFCGTVGSEIRCEYTVLGHVVNLAARLMEYADGKILCESQTAALAGLQLELEALPAIDVRGRSEAVPIWTPTGRQRLYVRDRTALVGRVAERQLLSAALQGVLRSREVHTAVIFGEAGIGKSRLLDELAGNCSTLGMQVLRGAGDAVDRNAPFLVWRTVVAEAIGIDRADDVATRGTKADAALAELGPEVRGSRPLLETVLGLELGDDATASHLIGEARAQATHQLVASLLQRRASQRPLAIVLEDAHWFDSASWALLRTVRLTVKPILLVLATRPMDEPADELAAVMAEPTTTVLKLGAMSRDDAGLLACQTLGVSRLPEEVTDFIFQRAGGNALFVEELALVLRDTGSLAVIEGVARLTVPVKQLGEIKLPATLEGLIVSRIDTLGSSQQMALKVASVVGRLFPVQIVQEVFPVAAEREQIPGLMDPLVEQDLLRPADETSQYLFKHVLTQEAIYGLMLFTQRRGLHRAVAEWYERHHAEDLSHLLPVLAHHWRRAEEWGRALTCLEQAAEQNLAKYANRETVDLLTSALDLQEKHVGAVSTERMAMWLRMLAEANFRLGNLDQAKRHGVRALACGKRAPPESLAGLALSALGQTVLRVAQSWLPALFAARSEKDRERRLWMTRILNRLTEIQIYAENALGVVDSCLREINTSAPAGPSTELAKAYAISAVVFGAVPALRGLARGWGRKAIEAAQLKGSLAAQSYVLSRVAIVHLYEADWAAAERLLRQSADVARQSGDRRLRDEAIVVLGITLLYAGRHAEALACFETTRTSAHFSNNVQIQSWTRILAAGHHVRSGHATTAREQLAEIAEWVHEAASKSEVLWAQGVGALAALRLGDDDAAEEIADPLLGYIRGRPVAYWAQQPLAAVAETYLMLLERAQPGTTRHAALLAKAQTACQGMRAFGNSFPFGKPPALLWDALLLWLTGHRDKALATWRQCIDISAKLQMPWEGALAARELGRHLPTNDPQRAELLGKAHRELAALGATWDLEVVERAIVVTSAQS